MKKHFNRHVLRGSILALCLPLCGMTQAQAQANVELQQGGGTKNYATLEELRISAPSWNSGDKLIIQVDTDSSLSQAIDFGGKNVFIGGYGIVSPGTGKITRFAVVGENGSLTLVAEDEKKLTFTGFSMYYENGGAIYSAGAVTITGSMFTDNMARFVVTSEGGSIDVYAYGGAIYSAAVTIVDSTFTENSASANGVATINGIANADAKAYGGAIYSASAVIIKDSTFTDNSTEAEARAMANATDANASAYALAYGGAIYSAAAVTITESSFADNSTYAYAYGNAKGDGEVDASAKAYGGAIYSAGAVTITDSSTFTNNSAKAEAKINYEVDASAYAYGGAIYSADAVTITESSSFTEIRENSATATAEGPAPASAYALAYGGAIYSAGAVTITERMFTDNSAQATATATAEASKSTTADASAYGGAIYSAGAAMITDSGFTGNFTYASAKASVYSGGTDSAPAYAYGGAIYSAAAVTIADSTFTGNSASASAKAYAYSGSTASVSAEACGGAIYSTDAVTITDSTFTDNFVDADVYAYANGDGGSVSVTAYAYGGAIYSAGAVTITDSSFTDNSAIAKVEASAPVTKDADAFAYGGAIYARDKVILSADKDDILFKGNTVESTRNGVSTTKGNAIYLANSGDDKSFSLAASSGKNIFFYDPVTSNGDNQNLTIAINSTDDGVTSTGGTVVFDGAYWIGKDKNPTANPDYFTSAIHGNTTVHGGTLALKNSVTYGAAINNPSFTLKDGARLLSNATGNTVQATAITLERGSILSFDMSGAGADTVCLVLRAESINGETIGAGRIELNDFSPTSADQTYVLVNTALSGATANTGALYVDGELYTMGRGSLEYGLAVDEEGKQLLLHTIDATPNTTLTWTGGENGLWNDSSANWTGDIGGVIVTLPKGGDNVVFDDTAPSKDVTVAAGGVTVESMNVTADGYTFSGGTITATGAVTVASGISIGLHITDNKPILSAASVNFNDASLNITGYTPGMVGDGYDQAFAQVTVITATEAVTNFNPAVKVANQANPDFLSASAYLDEEGKNVIVETRLSWYSTDLDRKAHGTFTIGDGQAFTLGAVLEDNSASSNKAADWDGNSLIKEGGGTLILNGVNTYTGLTTIKSGTLLIGGNSEQSLAQISGNVAVTGDGSILGGNGTILGHVTVGKNAILSPGSSIGTLTVDSVTFEAGSFFDVEVDPGGTNSDLLQVIGTATLKGGTVRHIGLAETGGKYSPIGEWTILTAAEIVGSFEAVTTDAKLFAFLDAELIYQGNNVYLKLSRNDQEIDEVLPEPSPNQRDEGQGLGSLEGTDSPLYNQILALPADTDFVQLYNELSGEIHATIPGVLQDYERDFARAMRGRLGRDVERSEGYPLWARIEGRYSVSDATSNTAEAKFRSWGLQMGGEINLSESWLAGLALRFGDNELELSNGRHSEADIYSFGIGSYVGTSFAAGPGQVNLVFGGSYGLHNLETERRVYGLGDHQKLEADYNAHSAQVFAEAGYGMKASEKTTIEPYLGLSWNSIWTESFTETGGTARLQGNSQHTGNLASTLGLRGEIQASEKVALTADLRWQHLFGDVDPDAELAFMGGKNFTIHGAPMNRDAAGVDLGIKVDLGPNTELRAQYEGYYGNDVSSHGGSLVLVHRF